MLEPAGRIEPHIGGGKAELAPALVAVDHGAGGEPRRAKKLRRLHHLALRKRRADRAGGDRPSLILQRRHDVDREAELIALLGQKRGRAGAVLAEMKIEADGGTADAEAADQNARDEILRRRSGERAVERHDDGAVEPRGREQPQLVAFARQLEQRVLRPQEQARVRREGQSRGLAAKRLRALLRCSDDGAMTAMHAVEIADRHDGAAQRAGVDLGAGSARDMKGAGFRFRGFAQRLLLIFAASLLKFARSPRVGA